MSEEFPNELVVYTDFDKTMTKQNTPLHFLAKLFFRQPGRTLRGVLIAFRRYGLSGRGFVSALSAVPESMWNGIANEVVKKLTIHPRWAAHVQLILQKYPNIFSLRLIIITRNLRLIPELFLRVYGGKILRLCNGKLRLNRTVIISNENINNVGLYRESYRPLMLADIIDRSEDKIRFIRSKNAFFIGDKEEYEALVSKKLLRKLHFYEV